MHITQNLDRHNHLHPHPQRTHSMDCPGLIPGDFGLLVVGEELHLPWP